MDGYEFARHVRCSERFEEILLMMISSGSGAKHRRHALEPGIDRYVDKPNQEEDLLDEINSVLAEASP